jgi:methylated-DNA-protein-cysteine methyltransferase-like protein
LAQTLKTASTRLKVVATIAAIPESRVTTYGAIGKAIGATARQVARVLANLTPEESRELPWFRVVASGGVISSLKVGAVGRRQIERLQNEGIEVTLRGRIIDFASVFWQPPRSRASTRPSSRRRP